MNPRGARLLNRRILLSRRILLDRRILLNRRVVVSTLAWVGGACAAVVVAMLALSLIGDGLGTGATQPLSGDAAAAERPLPRVTPPPSASASGAERSPGPARQPPRAHPPVAVTRLLSSSGGTAVGRCVADRVYLVSWSPAQGYRADEVWRGPGRVARVSFESTRREVTIEAHCDGGTPVARVYVGWNEPRPEPGHDSTAYPTAGDR